VSNTEGQNGGTDNEGADPGQPVESQQQADQQTEQAVGATQWTGDQQGESQAQADEHTEQAVGATQWTGDQQGESQAQADEHTEQAVAATQWTGDQQGESQAEADEKAAAAVAATQWSNVGTEDTPDDSTRLTADWSNVGLRHRTWASTSMPAAPINPGVQLLDLSPALSVFFSVSLDVIDLGMWSKMSGIGLQIEHKSRPDTAMSFFEHHLPGHITYNNITLERPISSDSQLILEWISTYHMLPIPTAGQIICLDQTGTPIMIWELIGVSPVSWKGPSMDSYGLAVATEQLTLAHMGFL
jgi:phage tail-like protein